MMHWRKLAWLALLALPHAAHAATLDRVRSEGVLRCGAPIRPGLAWPAQDSSWHGLTVDLCRAIAAAVLGKDAKIDFHGYALPTSADPARDEVVFLSASDMLAGHLLGSVAPGVPVFYSTDAVMVLDGSPARRVADLADKPICVEPGTGPERALTAWAHAHEFHLNVFMFQEADEMQDAYYGGRCAAIVHHAPNLAALALQAEADGHPSRLLPDALSAVPIFAATGRADGDWASVVAWTMHTVLQAEMRDAPLPLAGGDLGLAADWQIQALAAAGSYADIYRRNLGSGSPLDLPRGLNALWRDGGLLCPPFSE